MANNYGDAWTAEREARLRKLWIEGKSAAEIARDLGGVSRNAVTGKLGRLGLLGTVRRVASRPARAPAVKPGPRTKPPKPGPQGKPAVVFGACRAPQVRRNPSASNGLNFGPRPPANPTPLRAAEESLPPTVAGVLGLTTHACRWPIGDPSKPGFGFCGRRKTDGAPYCPDHARVAYQPRKDTDKAADKDLARALRRYL